MLKTSNIQVLYLALKQTNKQKHSVYLPSSSLLVSKCIHCKNKVVIPLQQCILEIEWNYPEALKAGDTRNAN